MPDASTARRGDLIAAAETLLSLAHHLDAEAEDARFRAITGARSVGMTWDQIGARFDMTGPSARASYERAVARAARRGA